MIDLITRIWITNAGIIIGVLAGIIATFICVPVDGHEKTLFIITLNKINQLRSKQ